MAVLAASWPAAWPNPWGWGGCCCIPSLGCFRLGALARPKSAAGSSALCVNRSALSCSSSCSTGWSSSRAAAAPSAAWNCVIKPMSRGCCCRGPRALAPRSWSRPLLKPISSALVIALPLEPGWWWSASRPSGRCRRPARAHAPVQWLRLCRRGHGPPHQCTSLEWVGSPFPWWRAPACNLARAWWGQR